MLGLEPHLMLDCSVLIPLVFRTINPPKVRQAEFSCSPRPLAKACEHFLDETEANGAHIHVTFTPYVTGPRCRPPADSRWNLASCQVPKGDAGPLMGSSEHLKSTPQILPVCS